MRSLMITKILQSYTKYKNNNNNNKKQKQKQKQKSKLVATLFPRGLHFLKRKSARSFAVYYLLQF